MTEDKSGFRMVELRKLETDKWGLIAWAGGVVVMCVAAYLTWSHGKQDKEWCTDHGLTVFTRGRGSNIYCQDSTGFWMRPGEFPIERQENAAMVIKPPPLNSTPTINAPTSE
jgi:hypothetical protein